MTLPSHICALRTGIAGWVDDTEEEGTDVSDEEDCKSCLLFLWSLSIMEQMTEFHSLQSESINSVWANKLPAQEPIIRLCSLKMTPT